MNTLRKNVLIALTVLGMGSVTLAARADDTTPPAGRHDAAAHGAQMQARMAAMMAKRQAKLHDLLKLTAQQEPAWTAYQAAIKPAAPSGAHPEHGAIAKLSSPDRLSKMIEMTKQHEAKMEAHLTALNAFYSQLTAEQKAVFDDHTLGGAHGGMHGGMRGGWGHRG
jgi:hypothetical protein